MTIELMEDQGHITWKTVHQILHDDMGQEENLHKVHCVQSWWISLFHNDSEELPGESLHGGDWPLTSYQLTSFSESKNWKKTDFGMLKAQSRTWPPY